MASKLAAKPKATPAPKNDNKKKANDNGKAVEEKKNNGQAKVNGNGNGISNGNGKDANGKAKAGSNGKANNNGNGNGKAAVVKKANGEAKTNGNGAKTVKTEKAAVTKVTITKKSETTAMKLGKTKPPAKPQPTKDKTDKTKANASPVKYKPTKTVAEKVQNKFQVTKTGKLAAVTQKPVVSKPTPAPLPPPSKPKVSDGNNVKSMSKNFPPFDKAAVRGTTISSPEIPKKKPTNGYQQVQNQEPVLAVQSLYFQPRHLWFRTVFLSQSKG